MRWLITFFMGMNVLLLFTCTCAMHHSPAERLSGRQARLYQGDPIGTAQALVDQLVAAMPTVHVEKNPEPHTHDGLVIEIYGEQPYQFITPGGSICVSGLPAEPVNLKSYFHLIDHQSLRTLPSGTTKRLRLLQPDYEPYAKITLTTWLAYWFDIRGCYGLVGTAPVLGKSDHAYLIIEHDLYGEPLHEHPVILGRLYA